MTRNEPENSIPIRLFTGAEPNGPWVEKWKESRFQMHHFITLEPSVRARYIRIMGKHSTPFGLKFVRVYERP